MTGLAILAGIFIQVNQAGYVPNAAKVCLCENPPERTFRVLRLDEETGKRTWHEVFVGEFRPEGKRMVGDFSAVTREGDYCIACGPADDLGNSGHADECKGFVSSPFVIWSKAYDSAKRMFVLYYTWQRCGSKKGWAGLCHQEPCPLVGSGRTIDARGGYHQSCDLRNWADGISLSVYSLLRYAELETPAWDEGELADEVRWGCDYFLRLTKDDRYVYESQFEPIGWGPRNYYARPAAMGAQANVVMLFARAQRFFAKGDPAYAAQLLERAKAVFDEIETNPFFAKAQPSPIPREKLPGGTQPWETWYHANYRTSALGFSQRSAAALELYRSTKAAKYAELAKTYGREAMKLVAAGEKLHDGCSYTWRLSGDRTFLELAKEFGEADFKAVVAARAGELVETLVAANMLAGDPRRGGSPSSSAANCIYLREAADLCGRPAWRVIAQRSLDWNYGANPEGRSTIEGIGQNQYRRPVFGQFFPSTPQIPGGVLHVRHGEYDMPPVGLTLWATALVD